MPQKILFLSPFFYPELISTGKYNTELAIELTKSGEEVIVGCSHPLYPDWKPNQSFEVLPKMTIIRGGSFLHYPRPAILRRLTLEFWFMCHACFVSFRYRKEIKTAIAVFPPSFFYLFVDLILPKSVKRIGIVHDLQGLLGLSGHGLVKKMFNWVVSMVENRTFNRCDRLVLLSNGMLKNVSDLYAVPKEKCRVRYPFISERFSAESQSNNLIEIMPREYLHIVYSGALGDKQAPDELITLFKRLNSIRNDVMCHIFSRGPVFDSLKNTESKIYFHDLVSAEELPELLYRSCVQIIPQKKGTSGGAFPSKLPNLLDAGVPVYAITDKGSDLDEILIRSKMGHCHYGWNQPEVTEKLSEYIDQVKLQSHTERKATSKGFVYDNFFIGALLSDIMD